jgi:hypothetical protein
MFQLYQAGTVGVAESKVIIDAFALQTIEM